MNYRYYIVLSMMPMVTFCSLPQTSKNTPTEQIAPSFERLTTQDQRAAFLARVEAESRETRRKEKINTAIFFAERPDIA